MAHNVGDLEVSEAPKVFPVPIVKDGCLALSAASGFISDFISLDTAT